MKLTVLTTITNPHKRQDRWVEAIECYRSFADQVVVVDGSDSHDYVTDYLTQLKNVDVVKLLWPYEWNWLELPLHLNAGLDKCTGDWIIKFDIDQLVHEDDIPKLRQKLADAPHWVDVCTMQKMTLLYGQQHYQKGEIPNIFRNGRGIGFGLDKTKETDLCYPIYKEDYQIIRDLELGKGYPLYRGKGAEVTYKTGVNFWNYDYFFKTKDFTAKEFFRFSRAYNRYYKSWKFGSTQEQALQVFLDAQKARFKDAPHKTALTDHPKWIREAVELMTDEQFGYSGWGLTNV